MLLINDKTESAFAALVAVVAGEAEVLTGKAAGNIPDGSVIVCSAESDGAEDPQGSGNIWVNASIEIRTSAEASSDDGVLPTPEAAKTTNQDLVAAVFGAIQIDDLATQLSSAVSGLTVFPGSIQFLAPERTREELGKWIDTLRIRLYACGSALT